MMRSPDIPPESEFFSRGFVWVLLRVGLDVGGFEGGATGCFDGEGVIQIGIGVGRFEGGAVGNVVGVFAGVVIGGLEVGLGSETGSGGCCVGELIGSF